MYLFVSIQDLLLAMVCILLCVCVFVLVCVHIYDLLQYIGMYQYVVGVKIQRMCCMKTWLLYYGESPSVIEYVVSFVMHSVMTASIINSK